MTTDSRNKKRFATDLSDEHWGAILALLPASRWSRTRRPVNVREVINAIRFLRATKCGWRHLPNCFPSRSTVRYYHTKWTRLGIWQAIEQVLEKVDINDDRYSKP